MQNLPGTDSARNPPRVVARAYGFSDRTHADWRYRESDPNFDLLVDAALKNLIDSPIESMPYIVLRLDDGVEIWVRRLREVIVNPNIVEVTIELPQDPAGEILF